jgi:hypothetical protein
MTTKKSRTEDTEGTEGFRVRADGVETRPAARHVVASRYTTRFRTTPKKPPCPPCEDPSSLFSEARPINEVDDIADVLFVGHAFEGFFRERDEEAEALGHLTVEFEAGGGLEFGTAGDGFER